VLIRTQDVAAAVRALADGDAGVRPVAGATALLVDVARGGGEPPALVDLTRLDELGSVVRQGEVTLVGAATTLDRAARLDGVVGAAAHLVATPVVRRQATIGGNVCASGWPRDLAPALWCAGAEAEVAGPAGRRRVPVSLAGFDPAPDEILVRLVVPDGRGTVAAGGGPTPDRPALRVLTGAGAGRAAVCSGSWRRELPVTGAAVGAAFGPSAAVRSDGPRVAANALAGELADLGVPIAVAAALAGATVRALGTTP
jgi:hypothetical protein